MWHSLSALEVGVGDLNILNHSIASIRISYHPAPLPGRRVGLGDIVQSLSVSFERLFYSKQFLKGGTVYLSESWHRNTPHGLFLTFSSFSIDFTQGLHVECRANCQLIWKRK